MKTTITKILAIVLILISVGNTSSSVFAEMITVTSEDVLEIKFDVPVLPSPDNDMFFIGANGSTITGNFTTITELFDGETLLGTYAEGYNQITSRWVTADSLSTIGTPQVIDFTSLLNGSIIGITRTTINGNNSITFDSEAVHGQFAKAFSSNSFSIDPVAARILSVRLNPDLNTSPVAAPWIPLLLIDDGNVDNSSFYGTYEVTLSVGGCAPDNFGLTIGNDRNFSESDGYIYVPHKKSSITTDEGTIAVSDNTISIDIVEDDGETTDIDLVYNDDFSSFTISGTITNDGSEECYGTAVGNATRWVFNKVSFPVTVVAEIDGVSQLKIKGSMIWWHHIGWEPPEDISLNDEKWYLIWPGGELTDCNCDSSSLNALESPLREDPTMLSINVVTARGEVEIVQQPSVGNDYTAVIEFDDHVDGSLPGPAVYEIVINYN